MASSTNSNQDPFTSAQLQRPASTGYVLVFPFELGQFTSEGFKPASAEKRVTEDDLKRVFGELTKSVFYDSSGSRWGTRGLVFVFMTTFFLLTLGVLFGVYSSFGDNIFVMIGALLASFLLMSGCMSYSFKRISKKRTAYLAHREADFNKRLQELNEKEFSAKQVRWVSGRYGAWLELHLEYLESEDSMRQTDQKQIEFKKADTRKPSEVVYGAESSRSEYQKIVKAEEVEVHVVPEDGSDSSDDDSSSHSESQNNDDGDNVDEEVGSSISSAEGAE